MRRVFADTWYWIALANPRDSGHRKAVELSKALGAFRLITTDEVLAEFLSFFKGHGAEARAAAVELVRHVSSDPNVQVAPQTRDSFDAGVALYAARSDKQYSLTDCVSMATMHRLGVNEVLTDDSHFSQEGFVLVSSSTRSAHKQGR